MIQKSESPSTMLGAQVQQVGVRFGVWAPNATTVQVVIEHQEDAVAHQVNPASDGTFSEFVSGIGAGARYRFHVDDGQGYPDPRSRFQPEGVHGHSEVIDLAAFDWTDQQVARALRRARLFVNTVHSVEGH